MHTSPPHGRRRVSWRHLAAVLLASALGLGTATAILPPTAAHAADLPATPLITWNMQGANSDGHSKWNQVAAFARQIPTPLLVLQEVGAGPPAENQALTENLDIAAANTGNMFTVRHSQWFVGRPTIALDVYFLRTQANGEAGTGGRVNTAIVTQRGADEVRVIQNPAPLGRALLGVRLGDTWYYTIHARSNGGGDAQALLQQVANVTPPGQNWVVAGDFNQDPAQLVTPAGSTTYATGHATQQSGGELDYVVASQFVPGLPRAVLGGFLSDHFPVQLGGLRAAANPTLDTSPPQAIESMQAGGVIGVANASTADNSPSITWHRDGTSNQAWNMDVYLDNSVQFRGVGSGRCLDIFNSNTATAGRNLVIFGCTGQASQRWTLEDLGDDQVRVHSLLRPDLCMNVSGGLDVQSGPPMIVWPCTNDPNERFVFTPAEPSGTPRPLDPFGVADNAPGNHSVESMQAGGVLDVAFGNTANNSLVTTFHQHRASNQGWTVTERADHAVQFRGVGSGRCLDIYNSNTATAGRELVIFDCKDGDSQWWIPEDVGNQQIRFRSVLRPDLCMNVAGGFNIPDGQPMVVWPCNNDTNERFVFTPYDLTGSPPGPDDDNV